MPKQRTTRSKAKANSSAPTKRGGRKALRDVENEKRGEDHLFGAAVSEEAVKGNRVSKKRLRHSAYPVEPKKTRQPRRNTKAQVCKDDSSSDCSAGSDNEAYESDTVLKKNPSPEKKSKVAPKPTRASLEDEFFEARDWRSCGAIDY